MILALPFGEVDLVMTLWYSFIFLRLAPRVYFGMVVLSTYLSSLSI